MLIPLIINGVSRMLIMNIPDTDGDRKGGKNTSSVLIGEDKAVMLNNICYLINYFIVIPQLNLPIGVICGLYCTLPLRWWQSLRVNVPNWWTEKYWYDSIPYVESLTVIATGFGLFLGLVYEKYYQHC